MQHWVDVLWFCVCVCVGGGGVRLSLCAGMADPTVITRDLVDLPRATVIDVCPALNRHGSNISCLLDTIHNSLAPHPHTSWRLF